jgi:hypothetical protein
MHSALVKDRANFERVEGATLYATTLFSFGSLSHISSQDAPIGLWRGVTRIDWCAPTLNEIPLLVLTRY